MAKINGSNVAYAAVFMVAGAGLTLGGQEALKILNPVQSGEISQPVDYLTQPAPLVALAFAGSTEAKQQQEAVALENSQRIEANRVTKVQNEAVFAAQIKPLLDVITALPEDERGRKFVVTPQDLEKTASYEVDYAIIHEIKGRYTSDFPRLEELAHDVSTDMYTYKEVGFSSGAAPFSINVGEDGFSITTGKGFESQRTHYQTVEELYVAIGKEVRILAPERLDDLSLLEQGQQPVNTASAAPAPSAAPALGM